MPTGPIPRPSPIPGRRFSLLSTYPPSLCGLATFSAALESHLLRTGDEVTVVEVVDVPTTGGAPTPRGGFRFAGGVPLDAASAAWVLSLSDVAIIQHEYGIYAGPDGDEVLDVLAALTVPAIVVLHTVPLTPTARQKSVLEDVCDAAARVVVMSLAAADRLVEGYRVDAAKVEMVPHGAAPAVVGGELPPPDRHLVRLLTWGLLGPGKGIEHVVEALAMLGRDRSRVRYTVAGATHPKVYARDGDAYRRGLVRRCGELGIRGRVHFDETYRTVPALMEVVARSSVVVLPYDSTDQVTSGVLVDAISAGRPVIATAFPHAVELLSGGAGIVVPHRDPAAMAEAIRSVATEPGRIEEMAAAARALAPSLSWASVADRYRNLCDDLCDALAETSVTP